MRRLLALVTATAAAFAFATPAEAKPFTYSDPKDVPANAGLDIVSVTYATEGTTTVTKVRGKKVKTYEPSKLVVTMTLAGPAVEQPGIRYRVSSDVAECGAMTFTYVGTLAQDVLANSQLVVSCGGAGGAAGGDSLFLDPKFTMKGNKLTWSIPLKSLPKVARAGGLYYNMKSAVDLAEPVLGLLGPDDVGSAIFDTASTDGDWDLS